MELLQIHMSILPAVVHPRKKKGGCWVAGISPPTNQNFKKHRLYTHDHIKHFT